MKMKRAVKVAIWLFGCLGVGGAMIWWLADHRRGIAWGISVVRNRFPDVSHLAPASLDAWLHDGRRIQPQIVDARSEEEYSESHLPGARRMGVELPVDAVLSGLDSTRPIVVYCSVGYRGASLARQLRCADRRDVWNLEGGIFAWANAGFDVERDGKKVEVVHPYHSLFARLLRRDRRPK